MTSQESKTFFKKLKETCKKIDNDVSDVKRKVSEVSHDEELAAIRLRDYQDKMNSLKTQANDLKSMLEPKLVHTKEFIQNFKELIAETEVQIDKQEDYLKQYGYKPLDSIVKSPPDGAYTSPVKEMSGNKNALTPNLLEYGIVQFRDKSSFDEITIPSKLQLNSVEKPEKSDSTPTLEITSVPGVKEETPPVPNILPNIVVFSTTPTLEL